MRREEESVLVVLDFFLHVLLKILDIRVIFMTPYQDIKLNRCSFITVLTFKLKASYKNFRSYLFLYFVF